MGSRLPVQHYSNSFIPTSLHDLNTVDSRPSEIDAVDATDALDHHDHDHPDSTTVECLHESYRNSLPIHGVGAEEEDRSSLDNADSSRGAFSILTIEDVSPIESARARFLQIIVDNFIKDHVIEVVDNESPVEYNAQSGQEKLNKRKTGDIQYEGDPRPLG